MSSNGNERARRSAAATVRLLGTGRVFFGGDAALRERNHQHEDATAVGDAIDISRKLVSLAAYPSPSAEGRHADTCRSVPGTAGLRLGARAGSSPFGSLSNLRATFGDGSETILCAPKGVRLEARRLTERASSESRNLVMRSRIPTLIRPTKRASDGGNGVSLDDAPPRSARSIRSCNEPVDEPDGRRHKAEDSGRAHQEKWRARFDGEVMISRRHQREDRRKKG
jgi:hypothetical protein